MIILCIETSTQVCSAALCIGGVPVAHYINTEGSNHAKLLPQYVEQLLQYAKNKNLSIEAVALSEGPGSYTGLRIGASTAKGICYGLDLPLIPLMTLDVLCASAAAQGKITDPHALLLPMLDARRMEVYCEIKSSVLSEEDSHQKVMAKVVEDEDWLPQGHVYYFGDGAKKCQNLFIRAEHEYIPDILPDAQHMGILAEQTPVTQWKEGAEIAYYEPFYLKEFIAAPSHVKGL